jgi:hypothetical protein
MPSLVVELASGCARSGLAKTAVAAPPFGSLGILPLRKADDNDVHWRLFGVPSPVCIDRLLRAVLGYKRPKSLQIQTFRVDIEAVRHGGPDVTKGRS